MSTRARALGKIERLYGLIETMHSVALQEAAARVQEVETAIAEQAGLQRAARVQAWGAMAVGDRESWAVAETQREVGGVRRESLEEVRLEREMVTEAARVVFLESRIQRGQMKAIVDAAAEGERVAEDRRTQGAADDRFLARLRWSALRGAEEQPA